MDGDKLVGAELFGTHDLMREFAERLLAGYLREGGAKLKVEPLSPEARDTALEVVRETLKRLPEQALRTHEEVPEGWPSGLRAMTLRDASGEKGAGPRNRERREPDPPDGLSVERSGNPPLPGAV